jgi:hypothetical protein
VFELGQTSKSFPVQKVFVEHNGIFFECYKQLSTRIRTMYELEGCADIVHGVASYPRMVDLKIQSIERDAVAESNVRSALAAQAVKTVSERQCGVPSR